MDEFGASNVWEASHDLFHTVQFARRDELQIHVTVRVSENVCNSLRYISFLCRVRHAKYG